MDKNFILAIFAVLIFNACTKKEVLSKQILPQKNEITGVEWSRFGGDLGYKETLLITKDSITRHYFIAADGKNSFKKYQNTDSIWTQMIRSINLNDFGKVHNGKSNQPADGTDDQIIIFTKKFSDTLINGEDDQPNYGKIKKFTSILNQMRNDF